MTRIAAALFKAGLGGAIACLSISPAAAQMRPLDTIDQTETIESVNVKSVAPALATVTGNQYEAVDPNGTNVLFGTATNGLRFEVHFRACTPDLEEETAAPADSEGVESSEPAPQHCRALYSMSVWDALPEGKQAAFNEAAIAFQRNHPTVSTGLLDNGTPYILRYVIADYGIQQGNLVSEFANFIRSATEFQNTIAPLYSN
jgi:hypothetical protein